MSFIELKNVSYKYPYTKDYALKDVNCKFEKGKFYGVIGENGGGKTTLCNLIRGLIPHFYLGKLTGECLIEGKDIREWNTAELSSLTPKNCFLWPAGFWLPLPYFIWFRFWIR